MAAAANASIAAATIPTTSSATVTLTAATTILDWGHDLDRHGQCLGCYGDDFGHCLRGSCAATTATNSAAVVGVLVATTMISSHSSHGLRRAGAHHCV